MRRQFTNPTLLLVAALGLVGCGGKPGSGEPVVISTSSTTSAVKAHADHATEGPHGGALAAWGDHEYHVEFVVDHAAKTATVYVLDGDAKVSRQIEAATLNLSLKLSPVVSIVMVAKPEATDPAGRASRFVGTHAALGTELQLTGNVAGKIGNKPYSGDFIEGTHASHTSGSEAVTQREIDLFLKPGGIYTAADIEKNGKVVPTIKFKGVAWSHDDDLKVGDKICPVTVNKADEKCTWWVNGELYQFCCPPCLEKFVRWAKETPTRVKPAADYVKK